eukprot:358159-Chlamydomonas_euryale.AAC.6
MPLPARPRSARPSAATSPCWPRATRLAESKCGVALAPTCPARRLPTRLGPAARRLRRRVRPAGQAPARRRCTGTPARWAACRSLPTGRTFCRAAVRACWSSGSWRAGRRCVWGGTRALLGEGQRGGGGAGALGIPEAAGERVAGVCVCGGEGILYAARGAE